MPGVAIARERLGNCAAELRPLMEEHARVVGGQLASQAGIDWELFLQMEMVGALHLTTARRGGKLLGYIFWSLARSGLEYKDVPHAVQGPWYVAPGLRREPVGRMLFHHSLADLRDRGFRFALPHRWMRGSAGKLDPFLLGLGAKPLELSYMLDLQELAKAELE